MGMKDTLINYDGQTAKKVLQGGSFTIPDYVTVTSPTSSLLASPAGNADTQRRVVGGQILCGFSDAAGPSQPDMLTWNLNKGDVVAVSAVASGSVNVTVNGVLVGTIACTAVAGIILIYG